MRLMQVRALLDGQGWYDLRQYRLNPPIGANIHWSRLVDLPIAALIVGLGSFLDTSHAERYAVAIAPLLPLLVAMFAIALAARRLIDPKSYPIALVALFFSGSTAGMFIPERIDHHGWQLALLAIGIAGLADPQRVRGGITLAVASALSLAIGLEMIVFVALAGAAIVLFWVADGNENDRVRSYAVSLGGTIAASFLVFASYDNRLPVCDALSPVWLSDALLAGALLYAIAWLSPADWRMRLAVAAGAAALLAVFHALAWPQCVGRFDAVPPETERLWRRYVQEAQPLYAQNWRLTLLMIVVPVVGLIGWAMLAWSRRGDPDLLRRIIAGAVPTLAATLLLFWQSRTAPAAQTMATIGCAAFVWLSVLSVSRLKPRILGFVGSAAAVFVGVGAVAPVVLALLPHAEPTESEIAMVRANAVCTSHWAMHDLDAQPPGVVFTFLDLGPSLITATHFDAVAGPYHRNSQQIADSMKAFLASPDAAHAIIAKYHSSYLLTCPHSWTAQHFLDENPRGFYAQLDSDRVPKWLAPVQLGEASPFRMWKVVR
jgi:hypothetical protein